MSMTENKAIERLECMRLFMEINDKQNESKFLEDDYIANKMAIQALEEIQQYRAIGTIEEFKGLQEKAEPKRLKLQVGVGLHVSGKCPNCDSSFYDYLGVQHRKHKYCSYCGQAIYYE